MRQLCFNTLEECFECYGRENLIPIMNLEQAIFYTANGCQPKYVCESEVKLGKVTFWFHKEETNFVYRRWLKNKMKPNDEKLRENI